MRPAGAILTVRCPKGHAVAYVDGDHAFHGRPGDQRGDDYRTAATDLVMGGPVARTPRPAGSLAGAVFGDRWPAHRVACRCGTWLIGDRELSAALDAGAARLDLTKGHAAGIA